MYPAADNTSYGSSRSVHHNAGYSNSGDSRSNNAGYSACYITNRSVNVYINSSISHNDAG